MHGPPALVGWLLVLLGATTGLAGLLRTRCGREDALMGVGMAAMAVPGSVLDPHPWGPVLFTAVFALAGAWAMLRHHAHHVVCAAAMVYMAAAMGLAGPDRMAAHGPGGASLLTGLLLVYFAAYVLAAGVQLLAVPAVTGASGGAGAHGAVRDGPELAAACRVSMALGMFAMLLCM